MTMYLGCRYYDKKKIHNGFIADSHEIHEMFDLG